MPIFFSPYRADIYAGPLSGAKDGFEIACPVTVVLNDDVSEGLTLVKKPLPQFPTTSRTRSHL